MNALEKAPISKENKAENNLIPPENLERLTDEIERNAEKSMENLEDRKEQARAETLKAIANLEKDSEKKEKPIKIETINNISKKQKNDSFNLTMKRVQSEMPTTQRLFSKIIHNKTVEKTSEVIGNTVARPNSILSGSISAFLVTLLTYYVAKTIGYRLSGSETMVAFIAGWILGLIFDYLKLMFMGNK